MKWKKEYEIGIDEIDNQHKKLISIVNDYYHHLSDKKIDSYSEIREILVHLINYTNYHFSAEEDYMLHISYPDLDQHIDKHNKLKHSIKDILIKLKNREPYTTIEFYYFLVKWLNNHILVDDMKIAEFKKNCNTSVKTLKSELLNPDHTVNIVNPNLTKIENMYKLGKLSEDERDDQRITFLQEYFGNFLYNTPILLLNTLLAIEQLKRQKIIIFKEINSVLRHIKIDEELESNHIKNSDMYNEIVSKVKSLQIN